MSLGPTPVTAREREALNASADGMTVATWLSLWGGPGSPDETFVGFALDLRIYRRLCSWG